MVGISDVIVTDAFRLALESSGLCGLTFKEVIAAKIVDLPWTEWDLTAPHPQKYPAGGEPENYIRGRKHSPSVAAEVGELWEAAVERVVADPGDADFVRTAPTPFSKLLVSDRASSWLTEHVGEWVACTPHTG